MHRDRCSRHGISQHKRGPDSQLLRCGPQSERCRVPTLTLGLRGEAGSSRAELGPPSLLGNGAMTAASTNSQPASPLSPHPSRDPFPLCLLGEADYRVRSRFQGHQIFVSMSARSWNRGRDTLQMLLARLASAFLPWKLCRSGPGWNLGQRHSLSQNLPAASAPFPVMTADPSAVRTLQGFHPVCLSSLRRGSGGSSDLRCKRALELH